MACKWLDEIEKKAPVYEDGVYNAIPSEDLDETDDEQPVRRKVVKPRRVHREEGKIPLARLEKKERAAYYRKLIDLLEKGVTFNRILNGLTGKESDETRMLKAFGFGDRREATVEKDRLSKEIRALTDSFNSKFKEYLEVPLTYEWVIFHSRKRYIETLNARRKAGEIIPFWEI